MAQHDVRLVLSSSQPHRAPQRSCPLPEATAHTPGNVPLASGEDSMKRTVSVLPSGYLGTLKNPGNMTTSSSWCGSSPLMSLPKPLAHVMEPKTSPCPHPHHRDTEAKGQEGSNWEVFIHREPTGQAREQRGHLRNVPCYPVKTKRNFTLEGSCPHPWQGILPNAGKEEVACAPPMSTPSDGRDNPSSQSSTLDRLGENHTPNFSDSQESRKGVKAENPTASPLANHHAPPKLPAPTASQRGLSVPSELPLFLPLSVPVPWDRGELPPPAKLPCLELQPDWDICKKILSCRSQICKIEASEGKQEEVTHSSITMTASFVPLPDAGTNSCQALPSCTSNISALPNTTNGKVLDTGADIPLGSSNTKEGLTPKMPSCPLASPAEPLSLSTPASNLGVLNSENEDQLYVSRAAIPPTSLFPRPLPTIPLPVPCTREIPIPLCMDSLPPPPLFYPIPPPVVPPTGKSLSIDTTRDFVMLAPTVSSGVATDDDIVYMDTTPPSEEVIFTSPPVSSTNPYPIAQVPHGLQQGYLFNGSVLISPPIPQVYPFLKVSCILCQGHLLNGLVPTNLPPPQSYLSAPDPPSLDQGHLVMEPGPTNSTQPKGPWPSLVLNQPIVPQNYLWCIIPNVQQHNAPIPPCAIPSVLPNMGPAIVPFSGGNVSPQAKPPMDDDDDDAMDTTPPSQASVFQSSLVLNNPALNQVPPTSDYLPHSGMISTMQGSNNCFSQLQLMQGSNPNISHLSNIKASSHPTLAASNGQYDNCFLSDPAILTIPAVSLPAPPVQSPRNTIIQWSHMTVTSPSSAVDSAVKTQQALCVLCAPSCLQLLASKSLG
ncbi:nuclear pore-associated protein 1-like [Dipodomys spectabilis]|uniref:nuclear pore-associated protein 1-like n=1 Tax=Dipodomys spectabilis TaxID=105255 RepID=UPI001C54017E|nr:nuclear pore-associated protein 1-like [Dipodomys spectabilis]